jgi:uncharacterized membrane protein YedE/YeeE
MTTTVRPHSSQHAPVSAAHAQRRAESMIPYVIAGTLLGIILVKSEVVSWYRIQEMFRFQSFHMYGVLGSAALTALVSFQLLRRAGMRALNGDPIALPRKILGSGKRYAIGGAIFGVGWALCGACPGPLFALAGSGTTVYAITFVAALAGTWSYGYLQPRLPN